MDSQEQLFAVHAVLRYFYQRGTFGTAKDLFPDAHRSYVAEYQGLDWYSFLCKLDRDNRYRLLEMALADSRAHGNTPENVE